MGATLDVAAAPISPEGRRLLRHASLHARHARLQQVFRGLRAQAARTGDTVSGRELSHTLAGLERELEAVRRELRHLGQAPPSGRD
jgi:hypothetical protein